MDQLNINGGTSTLSATPTSNATETDAFYEDKIKKLARLTQQGAVEWHTVDASSIPTLSFARVLTAYEATFGGGKLRLIETGYEKRYHGNLLIFPLRANEMISVVLSLYLVDRNGRPTFNFPSIEAIYDLLSEVKKQQSDINRFLSAIDAAAAATEEQQKQTDN